MHRASTIALGGLVVAAVVVVMAKGGPRPAPASPAPAWSATLGSFTPTPSSRPTVPEPRPSVASSTFAGGASARPLPSAAPKTVRFGVVLFRYRGAEMSPNDARSRAEALEQARSIVDLARRDFKAAVKRGDAGSVEDAGRIGRNILEPTVEYDLFTLAPGAVSEPIDTPRGYWVAKRIE